MTEIKPTRMELINLKQKLKLAVNGHKILKKKRDALIMEFFKYLEKIKEKRGEIAEKLEKAYRALFAAQAIDGSLHVKSVAFSVRDVYTIRVSTRNVMGVVVPTLEKEKDITVVSRGYSIVGTSVRIDEAAEAFEGVLDSIIELAEVEGTIRKLVEEIQKTKRRVNALEHIFIPRLKENIKLISMYLDEREREDFFRLKMIKKKMER
ncbi:MAG: V-type ATP synthase subunit D [Candidatus Aenigmarchaeota archaeon]|nr:V-type ATP synthase subunit D [Candidatus Aenigmarchaeota archaeon]